MKEKDFETKRTMNAICPWCGHEDLDSWELEDGEYDCGTCDKPYIVERCVDVSYTTTKIERKM